MQTTNWDKHADEPAVLAAKQAFEGVQASINRGTFLPGVLGQLRGQARDRITSGLRFTQANKLNTPKVGYWRIHQVKTAGASSTVLYCGWQPSLDFYKSNGEPYVVIPRVWQKSTIVVRQTGGSWKMSKIDAKGTCPGAPPA